MNSPEFQELLTIAPQFEKFLSFKPLHQALQRTRDPPAANDWDLSGVSPFSCDARSVMRDVLRSQLIAHLLLELGRTANMLQTHSNSLEAKDIQDTLDYVQCVGNFMHQVHEKQDAVTDAELAVCRRTMGALRVIVSLLAGAQDTSASEEQACPDIEMQDKMQNKPRNKRGHSPDPDNSNKYQRTA